MKIAQVCYRYHPQIGGVGTVVKEISEGLVRKGLDVEVLTQDRFGQYPATESISGVTVRRFRTGPLGLDFGFRNTGLRSFLRRNSNKYDLIHAHNYHDFSPLYAAWAKGGNRLVLNPHYHGTGHNLLMNFLLGPYRHFGKTTFEKADYIICVSQAEKRSVQCHFDVPDERLAVIPNGVHCERIAEAVPFPFDGKGLLCVGRLEKYKNIHLAIQALSCLPAEYKLTIIGSGPYRGKLAQLIDELHVGDRVQILSDLSTEQVYRWYKTCHLVLNLSSIEAFGMTVVEGLAAGKPVVVNNEMALAELATRLEGVRAVDAEELSPEQLADEIVQMLGIGREVPDLSEYTWDSIVERVKALYHELYHDL